MQVQANGISIEVEDSGGDGPVVLLVMGLGMQLVAWPEAFVRGFTDAGYRVLRHDNRDIGLSQYFDDAPTPNLLWQGVRHRFGLPVRAPYGIQEMADDALGLLDALDVREAHVIGISMGGMIAQRMAAAAPERVRSLVSIMSSSGAPGLPGPRADVGAMLMRRPPAGGTAALIEQSLGLVRLIAGTGFAFDEAGVRQRITLALERAYHPAGVVRQMLAVGADTGKRHRVLSHITSPTLVLHGDVDPLVPIACGRDTAMRIAGARFETIRGMGHDVPGEALPVLLNHILPFLNAADAERAALPSAWT